MSETALIICRSDELGGKIAYRPLGRIGPKSSAPERVQRTFTEQPAHRDKQQDLSEKDGGSLLTVLRRCSEKKRMNSAENASSRNGKHAHKL